MAMGRHSISSNSRDNPLADAPVACMPERKTVRGKYYVEEQADPWWVL